MIELIVDARTLPHEPYTRRSGAYSSKSRFCSPKSEKKTRTIPPGSTPKTTPSPNLACTTLSPGANPAAA